MPPLLILDYGIRLKSARETRDPGWKLWEVDGSNTQKLERNKIKNKLSISYRRDQIYAMETV